MYEDETYLERQAGKVVIVLLIIVIICQLLFSCSFDKEIQVEMRSLTVVSIDTVNRFPDITKAEVHFVDDNHVKYVWYYNLPIEYKTGSRTYMLMKR